MGLSREPVDLSLAKDFTLGDTLVRPSLRLISTPGGELRLEPRVMQVMVALARAEGAIVSRDSLVQSCWNGLSVGDDAINRVIARLRKAAADSNGSFRIDTVPRVGFRLIDARLTPTRTAESEGPDPRARPVDAEPTSGGSVVGRSLARLLGARRRLAAAAVLTLGLLALAVSVRAQPKINERIAVLEFARADSLKSEQLPALLAARIRQVMSANDLQIVARPKADELRGPDLPDAAGKGGVGYVLDGMALEESDDQIVVHAELIDARNNLTLWSREFRRKSVEADFMQDQVATHAAYVLRCALVSRRAKSGPQDPKTLALFLKACDRIHHYDGGRNEALESSRSVTKQVPRFSRGWSMLAVSAATASRFSDAEQKAQLENEARDAIARARSLDPKNPEPYLAETLLLPTYNAFAEREALIRKALKLDPNFPDAHAMLGELYLVTGRMADAVAAFRRAAAADPLSPMNQSNLVPALSGQGLQEQAAEIRDQLYRIWPNSPRVWLNRIHNAAFPGKPEDAAAVLAGIDAAPLKLEPVVVDAFRRYLSAKVSGDPAERRQAAEHYVELAMAGSFDKAPAFSALSEIGEIDRALDLARVYLAEPWSSSWPLFGPATRNLRHDPRFMALAAEVGLVDYWRMTGEWPDFCDDPATPYDCESEAQNVSPQKYSSADPRPRRPL